MRLFNDVLIDNDRAYLAINGETLESVVYFKDKPEASFRLTLRRQPEWTQDESPHLDATPRFPAEAVGSLLEEEKEN